MIFNTFNSFLFLNRCIGCDGWLDPPAKDFSVCPNCFGKLHFLKLAAFLPKLSRHYFHRAFSVFAYEDLVLRWIHQYKYRRKIHLGRDLAPFLAHIGLPWEEYDSIVPVPLHWRRHLKRGFNPSHLLAYELGKKIGKPVYSCLRRSRFTPAQTKLSQEERLHNVRGAFRCRRKDIDRRRILLIDDVLTTGATVNECAKVLKSSGAAKVDVLTLARPL